jgi:hypothetical protein
MAKTTTNKKAQVAKLILTRSGRIPLGTSAQTPDNRRKLRAIIDAPESLRVTPKTA